METATEGGRSAWKNGSLEMDMSLRNSVGARLMLSFAGVIVVFAVAVGLSITRLASFNTAVSEITGPAFMKVEIADAWTASLSESMRHTRNMLIMDDKAQIQEEIDKVRALAEKRKEYADTLTETIQSAEGKALLQVALDARANLTPLDDEYLRQVESGDFKAAKTTMLQRARPAQLAVIHALEKLVDQQKAQIRERTDGLEASYRSTRMLLITLSLSAVAAACLLALLMTRAIKIPLSAAAEVLGEIEKGNYTSQVTVSSNDEIGQTLQGIARMQTALRERTERESASAVENARIRIALDRVSAGAMLCDSDGKIVYMNDAARTLFRDQALEIRKEVPLFDPEQLLGGSFAMFHQLPSLEGHQLVRLTATHAVDVRMGDASLRIVINPMDSDGRRVGTVVQWLDRTQEVATEEEVQAIVDKAIDGDLTARIREEGKGAFFKALASGMNRLLETMEEVVRSMTRAAAEVRSGAEEISRGNANLSQRTEEQASSLEQTASSMEEMTSTVRNNADNAAQANEFATAARVQAEQGGVVVSAAVAAMSEINASSKRIADIISVIDEIAFQTNLLALNAAVEAARAGEQGRGFAVVASEVRNLASRSAEAAKEIKALIHDSVRKVNEGTKLVDDSGKVLGQIVAGVKKVTDVMANIASSSREQSLGIEQVNRAIAMMDDVTQQNAALVEEASAAAQALTDQASNLSQLIARFRVDKGAEAYKPQPAPRPVASAVMNVPTERRGANRPLSGKKKPPAVSRTPAPYRSAAVGAEEDWKDF
jgi:methyl-accepting chemotaxis protein